jgi:hypothetical protein
MQRLKYWKARRAGGRITLVYRQDDGTEAKVVGVDTIEATEDGVIATDRNGTKYSLGNPA